jgi:hypothetical protein
VVIALKWIGLTLTLLVLLVVALSGLGQWRWHRLTAALDARLQAARTSPRPRLYDRSELDGLPAPVQRYFQGVLRDGAAIVAAASVEHQGTFNLGDDSDQWQPFVSRQRVVTHAPGFVWSGEVSMLPGLAVYVHDAYVAGEGLLHPAILGLFSLTEIRGTPEVARGELMRFLAEAAWYPTALLPSQGVRWEPVSDTAARATLSDGPIIVTLTFEFGADGLIDAVRAESRGRTVAGRVIPTPWEGRWTDYQWQGHMRVPMSGEVAWLLPAGPKPYWRGKITALQFEFAQ